MVLGKGDTCLSLTSICRFFDTHRRFAADGRPLARRLPAVAAVQRLNRATGVRDGHGTDGVAALMVPRRPTRGLVSQFSVAKREQVVDDDLTAGYRISVLLVAVVCMGLSSMAFSVLLAL